MAGQLLQRDDELEALDAAVAAAADGRGSVVVLHGPAGIGKTVLVDAAQARARQAGFRVLAARASVLDHSFTLGVAHQLFEPLLRTAGADDRAQLLAGAAGRVGGLFDGSAETAGDGLATLHALYWLTVNVAERGPLALLVDDLHWADPASLRFVEYLARRLDGLGVLVVAGTRPDAPPDAEPVLAELLAGPATRVLRPVPLAATAVADLLQDALGTAPDASVIATAHRATGGNPLLVGVLAEEARAAGMTGAASDEARLEELGARGVVPAVRRRLRPLGAAAESVARAVVVLGERATTQDVAALAGLDADGALAARERLADAEVLAQAAWRFVHPLVAAAVTESCPAAERDRLHRLAALQLREAGARAVEVAPHWLATSGAGDPAAVTDLRAAAAAAASDGAVDSAVELLTRALAEPPSADERVATTLQLGELEILAQRPEGVPRLQTLLDYGLSGDEAARARAAIGTQLVHTDPIRALADVQRALEEARDPTLRLRHEAFTFEALIFPDALAIPRDTRFALAREDADPSPVVLAHLGFEDVARGAPVAEARALMRRALEADKLVDALGPGSSTWNLLVHALRLAGDAQGAAAVLTQGDGLVQEGGLRAAVFFVEQAWGYWHRDFGSVATGAARAQIGLEAIREVGLEMTAPALSSIAAENLARLDRLEEASALAEMPFGPAIDTFMEPFALSARGYVRGLQLRHEEAEADLRRVVALCDARGWMAPMTTRARLRLSELLARRGTAAEAADLAEHDLRAARAAGAPGPVGLALRARALATQGDESIALLRDAIETLRPTPYRLDLGWALHDLGLRLRVRGDRQAAREPLREALDLAARTDGARLERHVRAELDSTGARLRRERTSGVEALTPAERRAAELAADGLTNRQIAETLWVTVKTVELHLGQCYGKLGIGSRRELPVALGAGREAVPAG